MNAIDLWNIFMETGAPEWYLLYNKAKQLEEIHVSDDPGSGPQGHGLQ